jgi:hypothetical protein
MEWQIGAAGEGFGDINKNQAPPGSWLGTGSSFVAPELY